MGIKGIKRLRRPRSPTARAFGIVAAVLAWAAGAHACLASFATGTQVYADFEDGQLDPLQVATTTSPNYVQVVGPSFQGADGIKAAKFFWTQSGYDGTRLRRGAEAIPPLSFTKEGWEGYSIYVPSGAYPADKTATISQVFFGGGSSHPGSWGSMLEIQNNDLWIAHRGNEANPPDHLMEVMANFPRDRWVRIVVHFVASHLGHGEVQLWVDGAAQDKPTYSSTNINFGFGDWDSNDNLLADTPTDDIGLKIGMYNWDSANYTVGETRTLYYDAVSMLVGGGNAGFAIVSPVPEPGGLAAIGALALLCWRRRP